MRHVLLTVFLPSLAFAGGFQRLHADQATATSFLKSNWNKYEENYHPSYVLDDDPKTAWVEGAEGDGVGEALTIPVSNLASARAVRLVVFNGHQKTAGLLKANAAPKQLTVTVRGEGGGESARARVIDDDKDDSPDRGVPAKDYVPLMTQLEQGAAAGPADAVGPRAGAQQVPQSAWQLSGVEPVPQLSVTWQTPSPQE